MVGQWLDALNNWPCFIMSMLMMGWGFFWGFLAGR